MFYLLERCFHRVDLLDRPRLQGINQSRNNENIHFVITFVYLIFIQVNISKTGRNPPTQKRKTDKTKHRNSVFMTSLVSLSLAIKTTSSEITKPNRIVDFLLKKLREKFFSKKKEIMDMKITSHAVISHKLGEREKAVRGRFPGLGLDRRCYNQVSHQ
jgi:hypothetical protein